MTFQLPTTDQAAQLACSLRRSVADAGDSVAEFLGLGRGGIREGETQLPPEQRRQLLAALRSVSCLRELTDAEISQVADAMRARVVQPNETVLSRGEDGDQLLVIRSGGFQSACEVSAADGSVRLMHRYRDAGSFGETGLLPAPRSGGRAPIVRLVCVKALTPASLWTMDRRDFRAIVLPALQRRRCRLVEALAASPALAGLQPDQLGELADAVRTKSLGHLQAMPLRWLTFVLDGGCLAAVDEQGREIGRVGRGGHLGAVRALKPTVSATRPASSNSATVLAIAAAGPSGRVQVAEVPTEALHHLAPCREMLLRGAPVL